MGRTGFQPNSEETDTSLLPGAVEFASTWWPGAALSPGALELSRVPTLPCPRLVRVGLSVLLLLRLPAALTHACILPFSSNNLKPGGVVWQIEAMSQ